MSSPLPDLIVKALPAVPVRIVLPVVDAGGVLTAFGQPASGVLVLNPDQSFTYTPATNFLGSDEFTYSALNADGNVDGRVLVQVRVANADPVATRDAVTTPAATSVLVPVLANDNDPDGDPLAIAAVSVPAHGTVSLEAGQQLRYEPQVGFVGDDAFSYTVTDGRGGFASAEVTVVVQQVDGMPVARDDTATTSVNTSVTIPVLANDGDPEGDVLTLSGVGLPQHGVLGMNPDQSVTYTPANDYFGDDRFTYQATDGHGGVAQAEVTVHVRRPNNPPVARDDAAATPAGTPVTVAVLANDNDPDGDPLRLVALSLPEQGALAVNQDNTLTYTPNAGYFGPDEFSYTVSDGWGGTASATVEVAVGSASVTTFPNGYGFRRRLVVPASLVAGRQAGFPMWVQLAGDWLKPASAGGNLAGGANLDVRYELEDGTKLPHEIESYSALKGQLAGWVRVPLLSDDADNQVFLYYGKDGVAADEGDRAALWADYLAVWHLPSLADRSAAARNLTKAGTVVDDLGGLNGFAKFGGAGTLQRDDAVGWLGNLPAVTVQLRVKADATGHTRGVVNCGAFGDAASALTLRYATGGAVYAKLKTTAGDATLTTKAGAQTTAWQSLAMTWAAGDDLLGLFLDGVPAQIAQAAQIGTGAAVRTSIAAGPLLIGAGSADTAAGGWQGLIDEVRVRAGKLSQECLANETLNQAAADRFFGYGAEDTPGSSLVSPVAVPISVNTMVGNFIDVDVLAAAFVPARTPNPTLTAVGQPANGIASVIDGKVRYTPKIGYIGTDTFTYAVTAGGKTSTSRITVRIAKQDTGLPPPLRRVPVFTSAGLAQAIAQAKPGDWIELADGAYSGTFETKVPGTAVNPVVVKSANLLGASISGNVALSAPYTWLYGVQLPGARMQLNADGVRMSRCKQTDATGIGILVTAGHGIEIDHNDIGNVRDRGISLKANPANPTGLQHTYIHHNYIHDFVGAHGTNTHEALQLGQTKTHTGISLYSLVEMNLFEKVSVDSECVSIKSSDNVVQLNTLYKCQSHMTNRHGQRNQLLSNWIESSLGMRLQDQGGKCIGNVIIDCVNGLEPMAGDVAAAGWPGNGTHPACENWLIVANAANSLLVGYQFNEKFTSPARNNQIQAHKGPVSYVLQTGTTQVPTTTVTPAIARKLTPADVGPMAP